MLRPTSRSRRSSDFVTKVDRKFGDLIFGGDDRSIVELGKNFGAAQCALHFIVRSLLDCSRELRYYYAAICAFKFTHAKSKYGASITA